MAAPRASWKGHLKLSLVSCPVRLYTATSRSERVSFHHLHKKTHNRIQMKPHDPELGQVERSDLVKGYEYEKDHYVVLTDEDFEGIQIDSTKTIAIEKFVDASEVDQIYLDSPYYLAPDGAVAEETFRVIHQAMRQKKKVALSRLVMANRERLVALQVRDQGFLVTTLRSADEVRDPALFFGEISNGRLEKDMLDLAAQLIEQKSGPFEPSEFKDQYQETLIAMIKRKLEGQKPILAKAPERGKVINLMDALRQSLEEVKKPPARSRPRKPTTAAAKSAGRAGAGGSKKKRQATGN